MAAWQVWLIVSGVLFFAELLLPGFLVACFGFGCLAAAGVSWLGGSLSLQFLAFSIVSLIVFFGVRPFVIRLLYLWSQPTRTNVDALVGRVGIVTVALDPDTGQGRVKVGGEDWRGMPLGDAVIAPGEKVEVVRVDGAKLVVRLAAREKEE